MTPPTPGRSRRRRTAVAVAVPASAEGVRHGMRPRLGRRPFAPASRSDPRLSERALVPHRGRVSSSSTSWAGCCRRRSTPPTTSSPICCSACSIAVTWLLNRRGRVTLAAILQLTCVSAGLVFFFLYTSPYRIEVLFAVPVFMAAFVLSPWAAFVWAGVSSVSFVALNHIHGEQSGLDVGHLLDVQVSLALFGLAIIAWLVASCLEWTVTALRRTSEELEEDIAARRAPRRRAARWRPRSASPGRRTATLFEASPVGVFLFDRRLVVTECNERLRLTDGRHQREAGRLRSGSGGRPADRAGMERALAGDVGTYEGPFRAGAERQGDVDQLHGVTAPRTRARRSSGASASSPTSPRASRPRSSCSGSPIATWSPGCPTGHSFRDRIGPGGRRRRTPPAEAGRRGARHRSLQERQRHARACAGRPPAGRRGRAHHRPDARQRFRGAFRRQRVPLPAHGDHHGARRRPGRRQDARRDPRTVALRRPEVLHLGEHRAGVLSG